MKQMILIVGFAAVALTLSSRAGAQANEAEEPVRVEIAEPSQDAVAHAPGSPTERNRCMLECLKNQDWKMCKAQCYGTGLLPPIVVNPIPDPTPTPTPVPPPA